MFYRFFLMVTLCVCIFFSNISCTPTKTPQDKLYDEVMEIHDEVMPEMSTIHRLRKALKTVDTLAVPTIDARTISRHRRALDQADEAMMSWMAEFQNPSDDSPTEEVIVYLNNEKKAIIQVRDSMMNSIKATSDLLERVKSNPTKN